MDQIRQGCEVLYMSWKQICVSDICYTSKMKDEGILLYLWVLAVSSRDKLLWNCLKVKFQVNK